jgi:hypothetical protein
MMLEAPSGTSLHSNGHHHQAGKGGPNCFTHNAMTCETAAVLGSAVVRRTNPKRSLCWSACAANANMVSRLLADPICRTATIGQAAKHARRLSMPRSERSNPQVLVQ